MGSTVHALIGRCNRCDSHFSRFFPATPASIMSTNEIPRNHYEARRLPSFERGFGSVASEWPRSGRVSAADLLPSRSGSHALLSYAHTKQDVLQHPFYDRRVDSQLNIASLSLYQDSRASEFEPSVDHSEDDALSGPVPASNPTENRRKRSRRFGSTEAHDQLSSATTRNEKSSRKNTTEQKNREILTSLTERLERANTCLGIDYEVDGHKPLNKHNCGASGLQWAKIATLEYSARILEQCVNTPEVKAAILRMLATSDSTYSKHWTSSKGDEQQHLVISRPIHSRLRRREFGRSSGNVRMQISRHLGSNSMCSRRHRERCRQILTAEAWLLTAGEIDQLHV